MTSSTSSLRLFRVSWLESETESRFSSIHLSQDQRALRLIRTWQPSFDMIHARIFPHSAGVHIHFENNGRATGEADVEFESHRDATEAMKKDKQVNQLDRTISQFNSYCYGLNCPLAEHHFSFLIRTCSTVTSSCSSTLPTQLAVA